MGLSRFPPRLLPASPMPVPTSCQALGPQGPGKECGAPCFYVGSLVFGAGSGGIP